MPALAARAARAMKRRASTTSSETSSAKAAPPARSTASRVLAPSVATSPRRRETYAASVRRAVAGGRSPQSASIS